MPVKTVAEKLTAKRFHELYGDDEKPHFELLDGEAVQKSVPTDLHSILQLILSILLKELGFRARPELTLDIDESWQPIPDVCGSTAPVESPYPTHALAVAIEILSPEDRFRRVVQKCRRYAEWGIKDILVFDPLGREGWHWDTANGDLARIQDTYKFQSRPVELALTEVFRRMDEEARD
jgi:Uma2 family endonuclease